MDIFGIHFSHNDIVQGLAAFAGGYAQIGATTPIGCAIGGMAGRAFIDMKGPTHKISPMEDSSYIIKVGLFAFVWSWASLQAARSFSTLPGNIDLMAAVFGGVGAATTHRLVVQKD